MNVAVYHHISSSDCTAFSKGSRVALFGKQTASVALVAHWDLSHFTAVLDASPLTPGHVPELGCWV